LPYLGSLSRRSLGVGGSVVARLTLQRFNDSTIQRGEANFPHNLALVSVLYLDERPEMTTQ
jgi:hypothetical protein